MSSGSESRQHLGRAEGEETYVPKDKVINGFRETIPAEVGADLGEVGNVAVFALLIVLD